MRAEANAMTIEGPPQLSVTDRLAAAFLIVVMALGCLGLWAGVPLLSLYAAGQLTDTLASHFLVALPLILVAMPLFARLLFAVNRLYLRVTLASRPEIEDEWDEELDQPRWARGPLEPLLVATLVAALVALFVWFFIFAENPASSLEF